jgi:hypothetical protein
MKWRQEISKRRQELLASNEADRDLPRWQTRHGDQLKRSLTDTEIVIEKIHTEQKDGVESTIVELRVTNKHVGVILRPRNAAVYGYDADSPNVGGTMPIGARLSDSFGNFFKLENVSPKFYGGGSDRAGIRPGEAVNFTLKFADAPVRNSTYVLLSLQSKTVGQEGPVEFRLPADVFFGSPYLANRPH